MGSRFAARDGLARALALASAAAVLASCGGLPSRGFEPSGAGPVALSALATLNLRASDDPTVRGARLVPVNLDEARSWGVESGGAVRSVVAGLRLLSSPGGAVVAAADRLPASPSSVVELPERLGGGFVMALGTHLWRSATWLGIATPSFTLSAPISELMVGLDRLYLRAGQGPLVAVDPRTGANVDLGPLPASPRVVSVAALDAWRAIAVADLRGTLVTVDAGSSWRPVRLPIEPTRAVALAGPADAFAVGGFDASRTMQWWEVLPDGQASWLASGTSPPTVASVASAAVEPGAGNSLPNTLPLGSRSLEAAIEDGWPLTDGTALVARDGFLVRVRLSDGAVVETASNAFALNPARCHPFSLARPDDRGAFGFVCGETHGRTGVFRWDAETSRLVELRRFDAPREVLASGNGALAVRGPCARALDVRGGDDALCVMTPNGDWGELRVSGAPGTSPNALDGSRVVVLSNGRVALIRPPQAGDLSSGRLTLTTLIRASPDTSASTDVPLHMQPAAPDVARVLRFGVWMEGFEERRPGVLGGWIDAAGSILGVEIALDGEVRVGEYIRDAGSPIVSGRWGFGWAPSGGGFETTDGGMIWTKEIALPAPIAESRVGRDRSCSPVGCVLAGWLRVGWGVVEGPPERDPPPPRPRAARRAPNLTLDCAPAGVRPGDGASAALSPGQSATRAGSPSRPAPRGLGSASLPGVVTEFRPFAGRAGAPLRSGDLGLSIDASHVLDRGPRSRPLGRVHVWGPSSGDWDTSGHWQVLWSPPWPSSSGSATGTRSSAVAPAPWPSLEVAARTLGSAVGLPPEWSIVPGDDSDHALIVERRMTLGGSSGGPGGLLMLATLEADHAPVDVHRSGGEPWPDLQGAVRAGGRWYVATSQGPGELAATVVWFLDGAVAREIGRAPRVAPEVSGPVRLARRAGSSASPGTAVGLVATGPDADGAERGASLWVSSFDPEARAFEDPELLAPADLSDRTVTLCTGDDGGWEIETAFPGSIDVGVGAAWRSRLQGGLVRLRVSRGTACVDDVFGSTDATSAHAEGAFRTGSGLGARSGEWGEGVRTITATVVTDRARAHLQCRIPSR